MATACHIRARDVSFDLEDISGTVFNLTGHGNNFSLGYSAGLEDATTFGDCTVQLWPTITDYTVQYSGYWSGSAEADSAASKLHALVGASEGTLFRCSPGGSAASNVKYSGCAHVESVEVSGQNTGIVQWSIGLRPRTGSLTLSTPTLA